MVRMVVINDASGSCRSAVSNSWRSATFSSCVDPCGDCHSRLAECVRLIADPQPNEIRRRNRAVGVSMEHPGIGLKVHQNRRLGRIERGNGGNLCYCDQLHRGVRIGRQDEMEGRSLRQMKGIPGAGTHQCGHIVPCERMPPISQKCAEQRGTGVTGLSRPDGGVDIGAGVDGEDTHQSAATGGDRTALVDKTQRCRGHTRDRLITLLFLGKIGRKIAGNETSDVGTYLLGSQVGDATILRGGENEYIDRKSDD